MGRAGRVLAVAALVGAAGVAVASRLEIKAGFAELLPDDDPGVVALRRMQAQMGDMSLLLVGIRSPDPGANLAYAEALTRRLSALPAETCELAFYHLREVRDFLRRHRWLYVAEPDLEAIRDRLRSEIARRKNPLYVSLDDTPLEELQRRTARDPLGGRFPDGVLTGNEGRTVWVAAMPPGGLFSEGSGAALLAATREIIAADPPARYHPEMQVSPGGPVATALRNRQAVEQDILWVAVVCTALIGLSIGFYFRSIRAVVLIGAPAAIATVLSYAVARLAFGYVTSVTGFLTAFIMGNGTNYAIVLLARYQERRAGGEPIVQALDDAVSGVWRSTLLAATASALGYGSLMVTGFRGFSQFGFIGAVGCLTAWLVTFTVLPAAVAAMNLRIPAAHGDRPRKLARLGRLVERRPGVILGVAGLATAVALVGAARFLHDPFEYNFRRLSATIDVGSEILQFEREQDVLFGRWPQPTVILADRVDDVEPLRQAIRGQDSRAPGPDVIGQIVTVHDILPGDADAQRRKHAIIRDIRTLLADPLLEALPERERGLLRELAPPSDPSVLRPTDLPALARRPFTELDGTVGRVVLVYPSEKGLSVWNGRDLMRIATVLQHVHLPGGKVVDTSGSAVVFGAMIRSVLRDGPRASVVSLAMVLLLLALRQRPLRSALLAGGTLLVGVTWMVGLAGWAGVRITFLNFIALPFIIGIGAEYAVNVLGRFGQEQSAGAAVTSTGAAVALCSWSAVVGYGSLLAAHNRALRGLGAMATLGEMACLVAAVLVLPAALALVRRTARPATSASITATDARLARSGQKS